MSKKITIILLTITINMYAQDRIITNQSDTLFAKVTSIDKQKVFYYLGKDKSKVIVETPTTSLHKIIWRSGLEYIINQELEDKLKKNNFIVQKVEKPQTELKREEMPTYADVSEAPEIGYRRIFGGHRVNGKIKRPSEVIELLKKYDLEAYNEYLNGKEDRKMSILLTFISSSLSTVVSAGRLEGPIARIFNFSSFGLSVAGIVKYFQSRKSFNNAIYYYNYKKEQGILKPKMILKKNH